MNNEIFKYYIKEINLLSNFVKIAANDFNKVIQDQNQDSNIIWYDLQNIIVYASDISKLIWKNPSSVYDGREQFRKILKVNNAWELKSKKVRNRLEHIDERLITFTKRDHTIIYDQVISDDYQHAIVIGDKPFNPQNEDTLRSYNRILGEFIIFGQKINIKNVCAEIKALRERTQIIIEGDLSYESLVSENK